MISVIVSVILLVFLLIERLFYFVLDMTRLDWGSNNLLAVALGNAVYLWNAETADIEELFGAPTPEPTEEQYVSSVSWVHSGHFLAVGNNQKEVGNC